VKRVALGDLLLLVVARQEKEELAAECRSPLVLVELAEKRILASSRIFVPRKRFASMLTSEVLPTPIGPSMAMCLNGRGVIQREG
jgi:hypothetical protein